jgi:hypothetical protein
MRVEVIRRLTVDVRPIGVELSHGQPDGEDPQVAWLREEVLALPGEHARHARKGLAQIWTERTARCCVAGAKVVLITRDRSRDVPEELAARREQMNRAVALRVATHLARL